MSKFGKPGGKNDKMKVIYLIKILLLKNMLISLMIFFQTGYFIITLKRTSKSTTVLTLHLFIGKNSKRFIKHDRLTLSKLSLKFCDRFLSNNFAVK